MFQQLKVSFDQKFIVHVITDQFIYPVVAESVKLKTSNSQNNAQKENLRPEIII